MGAQLLGVARPVRIQAKDYQQQIKVTRADYRVTGATEEVVRVKAESAVAVAVLEV